LWSLDGSQTLHIALFEGLFSEITTINYNYLMGFCARRMFDSHHQPSTRMFTGVRVSEITFYAIFLRHQTLLMTYCILSGSSVGEDGLLVEEFWAWGLGLWLVVVSLGGYVIWRLVKLIAWLRTR
jgi:hypothetical protein